MMDADHPVTTIKNIGPAQAELLTRAGITTASQLRMMGADAAYIRLLATGTRPHFIMYYALHMALQGRPWNDCKGAEKDALRAQFDRLKADVPADKNRAVESILDQIGTGHRR